ncbi:peptidylprolyl isomerase [Acinetobacter sp. TGL-Y2]|uniref:SurA N-terminal domain-containing protein n=1 Tax=Acinetobacter sp. TGL-Y2 TaxID=1407071 RepID=UPI0007A6730E|nr:SurA N-terminal domain-containing protein [Acinetobacter sp. TGL-Y2]AMW78953.1 peptidylprolyl isomerase [Acinetobacter sp. TGL-Y2]
MESFRKLIKGWLGKVLLVLFLTPLALVGIEGYFGGGNKDGIAKTVNDLEISNKDLEVQTKNYKDQFLQMVQGDESLLNQSYIDQVAMDSLIDRAVLIQQAQTLGITLSDAQIEQMIAQQPSLQVDGKFDKKTYENYLRSIGMTNLSLINNIRQDHALKMLVSSITDNSLVNPVDVQQISNLQSEQRSLFMSSVKLEDYKKSVKATNQEIADYYNKHQNQFKQLASVDVDYVVVTPAMAAKTDTTVTDAELKQAYDQFVERQNKDAKAEVKHILITADTRGVTEAEKLAGDVYSKIQAGMTFADAAKQYSEDTGSKATGGVVEGYEKGVFGDSFDQAVVASKGQVSKPVKTDFGYHIITAQGATVTVPSFEVERERLKAEVIKSKTANAYSDLVNGLNELVVDSDALDVVSQELKIAQVQSLKSVGLGTTNPVLADPAVKAKLFNQDVKNGDRNASSNIQLANGNTVWIKVREYHPAGVQPLDKATAKVKEKLINQKAYDVAKAKVATMLADFKTLPSQQVLAKHSQSFENAGVFTRSQGLKREIERTAFSLATPKAGMWSVGTVALPDEMVIVAVADVKKPTADSLTAEQSQQLAKLYQDYRGKELLKDYTEYLKSEAKIK